jgi:hypothetical protein
MITYTTKAFSLLPDADEMRSNGSPAETMVLFNESESIQLEAVQSEIEAFEEESGRVIDSDLIDDEVMAELIDFLNQERLLDKPI